MLVTAQIPIAIIAPQADAVTACTGVTTFLIGMSV